MAARNADIVELCAVRPAGRSCCAKDPNFPFCSDRCRLIDLGKWASGAYVISAPLNDPEDRRLLNTRMSPVKKPE